MLPSSGRSGLDFVAPTRRTTAPRKRGDDTRARIIEETVRCIVEEGFGAATAKHVAERAGVTWGVIQYHFGDRNGLLMAVVDTGVGNLLAGMAGVDVDGLSLEQRIETVVDAAWRCYSSPTSLAAFEILSATRGSLGESSRQRLLQMSHAVGKLGRLISTDPAHAGVTGVLWAALRGIGIGRLIGGTAFDWTAERRALIDMVAAYLRG